ncbi:mediator of RNA polymerase II transcription subunit 1 isoform X2 [Homalodisca vitripennis]|uniref:mediator of RNA polymerase II transcription subunit 1 isoform X2 n=1 Tax=Homalodisca vitripennis TaxID=197043 RepID=UPI001EEB466A|nr:mediator of RNA polymerase II transcription subunit 1 isoform X2 [Homalodisca vitripennis]
MDKTKEWELEMLMEKLRAKTGQFKSFYESAKALRMALLEKRYPVDSVERSQLHKCLDTLQHNIKVTTVQAMVERLESVSRQLGLKFVAGPSGLDFFISTDMFYLELVLEPSGGVKDVKVHHEGKVEQPQSCEELVACLSRRDFSDFTAQLEGLASIYQLNAEKKVKCKAYAALTSLETDLQTLASLQSYIKEPYNLVHKSPVGILHKRRGGHCMKLVYFVSQYDLLDPVNKVTRPLTESLEVGHSVTVCMEGSSAHKLQTSTLVSINRSTKICTPVYAPLTSQNSASLPACFVLKLHQPMPVCLALVHRIQSVTEIECGDLSNPSPLLSLITQHVSQGKLDTRGLLVNLPDQQHCYFMTDSPQLDAVLIHNIPFSLPQHVPQILSLLRQQALFNSVVSSCIRMNTRHGDKTAMLEEPALSWQLPRGPLDHLLEESRDLDKTVMLEVSALSWQRLSVSLEHPLEESMATVELDLSDITQPTCKIYTAAGDTSPDYATKVFQRCLSIPVTMRALIKCWQREGSGMKEASDSSNNGPMGGLGGLPGGGMGGDPDIIIKQEPGGGGLDPPFEPFSGPDGGCPPGLQLADDKSLINLLSETKQGKKRKRESSKKKQADDCDNIIVDSSSDESILSKDLDFDLDLIEKKKSPPSILLDLENKNLVPPSVSITPITCSSMISPTQSINSVLERRPGIEIIPLVQTSLPSSITITPISSKEDRSRKSGKSSKSEDKSRTEKKRKRRKEDSGMGPPDKLPLKQDPLTKPVTVSIKPTDCGSPSRPPSPNSNLRKYSSSPTPLSLVSSKGSPKSVKHSPKHSPSPAYSVSSPKSSPKHGTSSPKHQGSSGKPSMSALKSAVSSPKSESSGKKSSSSKESSRDKDRKSGSSGHQSPKLKSSSVKLKQLDLSNTELTVTTQSGGSTPPSGCGADSKSQPMVRNRKGSLSAIVDKLKSAQHCGEPGVEGNGKSGGVKDRSGATLGKTGDKSGVGSNKPGESKNPGEYMVKPSSDGMKITINKTRTKDPNKSGKSSSSGSGVSSSGSGSPKTHTGLKPGVNSGPASKKPQQTPSVKTTSTKTSSKILGASKSSSSSVRSIKSSGSRDSRPRSTKPGDKSIFSSSKSEARKLSPTSHREDADSYKLLSTPPTISPELVVQGFMKQLDTKFQIPKLSQRTSNVDDNMKKDKFDGSKVLDQNKFMDLSMKADSKYPLVSKLDDLMGESKQISPSQSVKSLEIDISDECPVLESAVSSAKDDILSSLKIELPIGSMSFASDEPSPEVSEPIRPPDPPKTMPTPQEAAEILLDFSTLPTKSILPEKLMSVPERVLGSVLPLRKNTPPPLPPPAFPASPSVSVHIVKSPAPSPLVIPSPHSASPCITDDELMDEALVGIGK